MADYKRMYLTLFRTQTKAIELLQEAQQTTEDIYVETEPDGPKLFTLFNSDDEPIPDSNDSDPKE